MITFYNICAFLLALGLFWFAAILWLAGDHMADLSAAARKASSDCHALRMHLAQLLAELAPYELESQMGDAGVSEALALAKAQLDVEMAPIPFKPVDRKIHAFGHDCEAFIRKLINIGR